MKKFAMSYAYDVPHYADFVVSLATSEGEWDFHKCGMANDECGMWTANYFPRGDHYATQSGQGATPREAMLAAISPRREGAPSPTLADCQTPDDLLAAASLYEERAA
jgi:hypothetical protein